MVGIIKTANIVEVNMECTSGCKDKKATKFSRDAWYRQLRFEYGLSRAIHRRIVQ